MELILWRHAEAEPGTPDGARALTTRGQKQASTVGKWLDLHLPDDCEILVSPAVRTIKTAEALGRAFKTHASLAPDTIPEHILAAANWPHHSRPVLIVGHQSTLGLVAAFVIAGQKQEWHIRKGHVFWISQRGNEERQENYIRTVIGPASFKNY